MVIATIGETVTGVTKWIESQLLQTICMLGSSLCGFFSDSTMSLCEVALVPLVLQISSANIPDAEGRGGDDYSILLKLLMTFSLMGKSKVHFQSQAGKVICLSELYLVTQCYCVLMCINTKECMWGISWKIFLVIVKWKCQISFPVTY